MATLLSLFLALQLGFSTTLADAPLPRPEPASPTVGSEPSQWVYLTIDDGPSAYTEGFLATLAEAEVVATFFWVAGPEFDGGAYDGLARRLVGSGHQLASHSTSHPVLTTLSDEAHWQQLAVAQARLERAAGQPITLFRPPYGIYNRLTEAYAEQLGQRLVLWTVDPADWELAQQPQLIITRVLEQVHPDAIILIHERPQTLAVLPDLLAALKEAGYGFALFAEADQKLVIP